MSYLKLEKDAISLSSTYLSKLCRKKKQAQEVWFIFQENKVLINPNKIGGAIFASLEQKTQLEKFIIRHFPLSASEANQYFCAEISSDVTLPTNVTTLSLRKAFELIDETWYRFLAKAYAVINWERNHQYCGHCGVQTQQRSTNLYEKVCPLCGLIFYPRISPCIIVLIKRNNEALLARSPHFPAGMYALIAGFVEAGESLEEAVAREVQEEVGLTIKNLKYFGSQPWPFPDSLMIGFNAEYEAGEIKIDANEIEDAGWYRFDKIPGRPRLKFSIASQLIDAFIKEQQHDHL